MVWIIDEKEVFAINQELTLSVRKVGETSVVFVDNLYKNPDLVRELILNSPATNYKKVVANAPGARHKMLLDLTGLQKFTNQVTEKIFHSNVFDELIFVTNLYRQTGKPAGHSGVPHADPAYLSGIIFLNTPEECYGGTAFYKHRKTGSQFLTPNNFITVPDGFEFITGSDENWELLELAEMKYNRMILYRADMYHSPYIKKEWFQDYYRINQVIYFVRMLNDNTILRLTNHPVIEEKLKFSESGEQFREILLKTSLGMLKFDFSMTVLPLPFEKFFSLVNGKRTLAEILILLAESYNLNDPQNLTVVRSFVKQLFSLGLLADTKKF